MYRRHGREGYALSNQNAVDVLHVLMLEDIRAQRTEIFSLNVSMVLVWGRFEKEGLTVGAVSM